MKKYILLLLVITFGFGSYAQTEDRVQISGEIKMPSAEDAEGISIFNLNSKRGTLTNINGNFKIRVAEGDSLRVSSVQFQSFTVIIDEGVIESGELNISVTTTENVLPEVVVTPYDLSGNVQVDISRLKVVEVPDTLNAMDVRNTYYRSEVGPDYQSPPRNYALRASNTRLVDGLNFANIFRELFSERRRDQVARVEPVAEVRVRELYEDEFFRENLGIKMDQISEFLNFIDEEELTEEMLQEGGELDLIEFLIEESKRFKSQRPGN